jgi:hypothetical protein
MRARQIRTRMEPFRSLCRCFIRSCAISSQEVRNSRAGLGQAFVGINAALCLLVDSFQMSSICQ